jgi:hypothetical protein
MRVLNVFIVLWAVLMAVTGTSPARTIPFTMSELAELPREAHGLRLHVRAVKDTFLLGEPIMIEVLLHNASRDTVLDRCMLSPIYGPLNIYAVRSDSDAVRLNPELQGDAWPQLPLKIPPDRCVGTVVIFGSYSLIRNEPIRAAGEYRAQPFSEPGTHRFLATYYPKSGEDATDAPTKGQYVVSNLDSFSVVGPSGWDQTVYEAVGDTLLSLLRDRPGRRSMAGAAWVRDTAFWEDLCRMDSTSVYAPWLWAAYARSIAVAGGSDSTRFISTSRVLEEMVERFPAHRLSS